MPKAHFNSKLFKFLRELSINNDRTWFKANKDRYEAEVRAPFLAFIADFEPHGRKISKHIRVDPRPVGGSFFRIYRDTRFSKDKTPYKTHASAQFRHDAGKDVHAPGLYLHLEPGNCFLGAGVWRPESEPLKRIRTAIAEDPKAWKRCVGGKAFKASWKLGGDSLKRPPRGFDKEHPMIVEIMRKDFIAVANIPQKEVTSADFPKKLAQLYKGASPLCRFIATACELPW